MACDDSWKCVAVPASGRSSCVPTRTRPRGLTTSHTRGLSVKARRAKRPQPVSSSTGAKNTPPPARGATPAPSVTWGTGSCRLRSRPHATTALAHQMRYTSVLSLIDSRSPYVTRPFAPQSPWQTAPQTPASCQRIPYLLRHDIA